MPSRREFLQTSAAAVVALNGINAGSAAAAEVARTIKPRRAIYDDRYAEGRRFAEVFAAQGVPTHALDDGDVTRFWYEELDALWKREPVAIAGFTQFGPMFVIERFALEQRMQVVLRIEHRAAGLTTQATPARAQPASSVIHYYTPLAVQQGYGPALDGPLYSWVVAPSARA